MTLREFWEVASFCVAHPSMLIRNYLKNKTDSRKIDNLIDALVENRDRLRIYKSKSGCRLLVEFEGNFYCFWVANKFYSYLTVGKCSTSCKEAFDIHNNPDWIEAVPSRLRAIRFYKAIDRHISKIRRDQLLLPAKYIDAQDAFYNHPDEITARKYMQRDPETLRRLGVFDPE